MKPFVTCARFSGDWHRNAHAHDLVPLLRSLDGRGVLCSRPLSTILPSNNEAVPLWAGRLFVAMKVNSVPDSEVRSTRPNQNRP